MIPVFRPCYNEEEIEAVSEVLRSGWIGLGPKTEQFESAFAEYVGSEYAIAVNSATAALHLSCLVLGVQPGDEVLVPTMTFVSTAHAVSYCGAKPVFCDVEPDTLNIDPQDAENRITERTKAIIPVHYGGHACDMNSIWRIAQDNNLAVIEDAAHACGSKYQGRRIGGLLSDTTAFSFHAVKNLSTSDGGMITTNHIELAQRLRRLRWCGIDKSTFDRTEVADADLKSCYRRYTWYYEVHELGFKYHMNDVAAALGIVQLQKLDKMNARRREIVQQYNKGLANLVWLELPVERDYTESALHNYVIRTAHRDELNQYLRSKGIATGVHYMPIHLQPCYRQRFWTVLPMAEVVWTKLLTLPLYPDMTDDDVQRVITEITAFGKEQINV